MSDLTPSQKQRTLALLKQMQARLDAAEMRAREPVAVIGIGCRLPGGQDGAVDGAAAFWAMLDAGIDAVSEVPPERWDAAAWYDSDPDAPGKANTRWGGFLSDVDLFDPEFFGISPREAVSMDPQQRLILETAWRALEHAGVPPLSLTGSSAGVFLGICTSDYARLGDSSSGSTELDTYSGTGGACGVAAGRLSYVLGLNGPSLVVDTACSSSLVATHLAVQALRLGECDLALAGGVNLTLSPDGVVTLSKLRMMAPDGRCKPFDAAANGFVRGEGCGVLVLKRLADARKAGDRVLAVISGTAVNQDGRSSGLTAPSGLAQEAVIKAALANAGRQPGDVTYIEAHGTGTALGDPIELNALSAVMAGGRTEPVLVGSVKSNLGHLEAAAGVAGLIKAIGVVRQRHAPPTLHFHNLNPDIANPGDLIRIAAGGRTALDTSRPVIGVSSFGFSGTNAHVVLEAAGDGGENQPDDADPLTILVLSARSPAALARLVQDIIASPALDDWPAAAAALAVGRSGFEHRIAVVAASADEARQQLATASIPADPVPLTTGQRWSALPGGERRVALEALAAAFVSGAVVDWVAIFAGTRRFVDGLPGHPFQRRRYWRDGHRAQAGGHPLLGDRIDLPNGQVMFRSRLPTAAAGYLQQHSVAGRVIMPAAALLELAASALVRCGRAPALADITFDAPVVIDGPTDLLLTVDGDRVSLAIRSATAADWQDCLTARATADDVLPDPFDSSGPATVPVDPAALYGWLQGGGLDHGPLFRRVTHARQGPGVAWVRLNGLEAGGHGLHPAVLDAAFQSLAVMTWRADAADQAGAMRTPAGVQRFVLTGAGQVGGPLTAHARQMACASADWVADIILLDTDGTVVGAIQGLRLSGTGAGSGANWRNWLLGSDWPLLPVPAPADRIADAAEQHLRSSLTDPAIMALGGLGPRMDAAASAFAATALQQVRPDQVVERHRQLYDHLKRMAQFASPADPAVLMAAIGADYPDAATEIALLARCGNGLAATLTGQQDGLALLFPADAGADGNVYRDSPASSALNGAVQRAVLAALPVDGPIRVLEVGAGTGGTTDGLIACLPAARMAEYAVTDIAPTLLAAAADRYARYPFATTARLDLEADPEEQGIRAGRYHLIVAANVIHATRDLTATLIRLRRLLAPGGALVLLEGRGQQGWVDLCFGLTEGWWLFADHDHRPDHPMPDTATWQALLRRAGFAPAAATVDDGPFARQLILTARPVAHPRASITGDSPLAQALSERLSAADPDTVILADALDGNSDPASVDQVMARQKRLLDGTRIAALTAARQEQRLVLLTTGATTGACPMNAPLWGLGRAIAAERPELAVLRIDIDGDLLAGDPQPLADLLADNLRHPDGEDQIRLSAGGRRVARLRPVAPSLADWQGDDQALGQLAATRIDPAARYLITGGFGGLGLFTAKWLADRGARKLVLLGRSAPRADAVAAIAGLEGAGVTVWPVIGDVGVEGDVRATLATGNGRLAGVVHSAGALDDGLLPALDWSRMESVLGPKLAGSWLIDRLAGPLDFLLLYSSAAGLIGTRGQANHIAANAWLDALAAARTARGQWTVSLAWGAWSEIGSATSPDLARRLIEQGMDVIAPAAALPVLDWALSGGAIAADDRFGRGAGSMDGRIGVLPIHPAAFARAQGDNAAAILNDLLSPALLAPARALAKTVVPNRAVPAFASVPLPDRIRAEAARVLAADSADAIDPRRNLFDLGLDSLMAVQLRNRLQNALGLSLSPTLLFDHPSCEQLASHLASLSEPVTAPAPLPVLTSAASAAPAADSDDAIAIIGMDCRFPGGADGPDAFWTLLLDGFDAVGEFPAHRRADCGVADDARQTTRWGAFLDQVDRFDAAFFRIAPREAASMDPQQRLWLETAWRALEAAGQPPDQLAGSPTGVFVGLCNYDYAQIATSGGRIDAWSGTGGAPSIVAGRLAYLLGLEGPALVVDTACSSSLVAVHLACRALADGDCRMAVAGGVNLILAPSSTIALSELQMMAPDGRCKAFDAAADGFVRGEGCGAVILKRLDHARADGDTVLAVIRGSAVNQDGRSSSLTAPSGRAQERAVRAALGRARISPDRVGYIETHGTGTALGDPIEIHALKAVFGPARDAAQPLALGAVKTNLGHLEAAAGIAGLIKTVMALRHGIIPPNNHLKTLNPHIELDGFPVHLPATPGPWPVTAGLRVAGVSAFGFSGTNVHLILEQAADQGPVASAPARPIHLLVASGAGADAARLRARDLASRLMASDGPALGDLAHTSLAGRARLDARIAVVAASAAEAADALLAASPTMVARPPRVGWLFTGQGSQRPGMGRGLYRDEPVFRAAIDRMAAAMADGLDRPLTDILWGDASGDINNTAFAQPALFALGFALAELYRHWGLAPAAVMGHSVGEYIAAAVAGAAEPEDIARLIVRRGALMQALPAGGAMAAVMAAGDAVASAIGGDAERVAIAALNGPANTVISGDGAAVDRVIARLEADGVVARRLAVSHAFHSARLDPMLSGLEQAADAINWRPPQIPLFGNLTGGQVGGYDGAYWRDHARQPVRFANGLHGMAALGCDLFLELGPQPILTGMGRRVLPDALWLPSLDGTDMETPALLRSLAGLFSAGADLGGGAISGGRGQRIVETAPYPFERQRHWVEVLPAATPAIAVQVDSANLAGQPVRGPGRVRRFQNSLSPDSQPWLADHRVRGRATLPAAAMVLALSATAGGKPLRDLAFHRLLSVEDGVLAECALDGDGLTLHGAPASVGADGDDWSLVAEAYIAEAGFPATDNGAFDLAALSRRCPDPVDVDAFYASFPAQGIAYGPLFRPVSDLWAGRGEALARLMPPAGLRGDALRAVVLDGAFQCLGAAASGIAAAGNGYLPVGLARFQPFSCDPVAPVMVWARLDLQADGALVGDLALLDEDGVALAEAGGLVLRPNEAGAGSPVAPVRAGLFATVWEPAVLDRTLPTGIQLVGGDRILAGRLSCLGPGADANAGLALLVLSDDDPLAACMALHRLAVDLIGRMMPPRLVVVTQGAMVLPGDTHRPAIAAAAVSGAVASLAIEHPELDVGLIDLVPGLSPDLVADGICQALTGREGMLAVRNGQLLARRLERVDWPQGAGWGDAGASAGLQRPDTGQLGDLAFAPLDLPAPAAEEVLIEVTAAGLNFRDVMNALGSYPGGGGRLGGECAGFVAALGEGVRGLAIGQPVMAVAPGCHATHVIARAALTLPIPQGWSHEQAATMPTVFLTAAHALRAVGCLRAGERVLVHAGTGGLGLAAIQIAHAAGAQVLATAGSEEKRAFLRRLGIECVGDSRSPAFMTDVRRFTGGQGVDVVLNALSGPMIGASLEALAPGGRFLEVGKAGIWSAEQVKAHRPDVQYRVIALDEDIVASPDQVGRLWRDLMGEFAAGVLQPLPVTPFALRDPEPAFRHMQAARHIGRIALTRRSLRADAAYLITGGTGAIGRALAGRLAADGAGTVILASRRATDQASCQAMADLVADLARRGCELRLARLDLTDEGAVGQWLDTLDQPLAGIYHAAGVLDDGVFTSLTTARFASVLDGKLGGALLLDRLTRHLPLDRFVLFSSAAAVVGSAGQANYAAANAGLLALAQDRQAAGLPATVVAWGAWAGTGMASGRQGPALSPAKALAALDDVQALGLSGCVILPVAEASLSPTPTDTGRADLLDSLQGADAVEWPGLLRAAVRGHAAAILGLPADSLDGGKPLNGYGLDSLMAVELRNALAADIGSPLPASLIFDYPGIDALAEFLAGRLAGLAARPEPEPVQPLSGASLPGASLPNTGFDDSALDAMSEDELARALMEEMDRAGY